MPLHCLFKDLGGEVAFPLSFFWLLSLVALALGATGRLFGRFWKCETGGTALDRFLGGFGSCGEISPCKVDVCRTVPNRSGGLQNRSEPFRRCAEPFRTVLETSALRKLSRKLVLCAKNPGNRKARTRLSHSGCISPNLKVTHHHPQEPHR